MTVTFRSGGKVTTNQNTIIADPTAILQAIEFVKQFSNGDPNNLNTTMLNKLINE